HMVKRPGERDNSPRAHPSISRLQTDHPAQCRRLANRPRRVRPNRAVTKPGSHRGRRPSGRPSSDVSRIPGVMHFAEVAHPRAAAEFPVIVMNAFNVEFSFSMRSRQSRVSSTGEIARFFSFSAISRIDEYNSVSHKPPHYRSKMEIVAHEKPIILPVHIRRR